MLFYNAGTAALLLATAALASPLAVLERDCTGPVVTTKTNFFPTSTVDVYLTQTTFTDTYTVSLKATKTVRETITNYVTKYKTVTIPVSTVSAATTTTTVTGPTVTSNPYGTFTVFTTLAGTPPPCYTQTCLVQNNDPTTRTFATGSWYALVTVSSNYVKTIDSFATKTVAGVTTVAAATKVLSTVTVTNTYHPTVFTFASVVLTTYATPGPATCS
ncbi:hypothetical protein TWF694_001433 [Orbilia ellipsospora]|uniref:Uncharacterized protein n=1 Tax=Orbilia ellipsospora TaxID=2528407 RepID=A0AAV9XUZ2_9PEZI